MTKFLSAFLAVFLASILMATPEDNKQAQVLIDTITQKVKPLDIAANRAWWDANITGKDEDFQRKEDAQNKIDEYLSDPHTFAQLKALKEKGQIDDPIVRRALHVVYLAFLEKQVD